MVESMNGECRGAAVVVRAAGHQMASYSGLVSPRGGRAEQFERV